MTRRIGITMRTAQAEGHDEPRDALARDWGDYVRTVLPDVLWQPLPNLGKGAVDHARAWGIDGFIFTGGDDLGASPARDETEYRLLEHALDSGLPVFGVCRGLQLLQQHCGGAVERLPGREHLATRHPVVWVGNAPGPADRSFEVNSYHAYGIREDALAAPLEALALAPGGWVEAARHRSAAILAVMWHPEREQPYREHDARLLRSTLGLEPRPSGA